MNAPVIQGGVGLSAILHTVTAIAKIRTASLVLVHPSIVVLWSALAVWATSLGKNLVIFRVIRIKVMLRAIIRSVDAITAITETIVDYFVTVKETVWTISVTVVLSQVTVGEVSSVMSGRAQALVKTVRAVVTAQCRHRPASAILDGPGTGAMSRSVVVLKAVVMVADLVLVFHSCTRSATTALMGGWD